MSVILPCKMLKFVQIIKFFRPKTIFSFKEKIFYTIFWMAVLNLLVVIPINFSIGSTLIGWLCVASIFVYVGIYYLAFHREKFFQANILFFAFTALLLAYFYFEVGGMQNRVPLYFIILGAIVPLLLPMKWQWKAIVLILLAILLLAITEYFFPELITSYPDEKLYIFVDMTATHIILTYTIFMIIWIVKKSYDESIKNLEIKEKLIMQKNSILADYSKELEEKNKELIILSQSKDRLFSIIAHDLRSPLCSSKTLVELAYKNEYPVESLKDLLPDMYQNFNYVTNLVDNLLYWAKSQIDSSRPSLKRIKINDFLCKSFEELQIIAKYKEIEIHFEISSTNDKCFFCDEQELLIMLRNLFSNAVKFSYQRGKIVVGTYVSESFLQIYIEDEGKGISPENLLKISNGILFSSKGTLCEKGTGLGLNLVQNLMKRYDGFMQIQSKEGKGTKASLLFPINLLLDDVKRTNALSDENVNFV